MLSYEEDERVSKKSYTFLRTGVSLVVVKRHGFVSERIPSSCPAYGYFLFGRKIVYSKVMSFHTPSTTPDW